MFSKQKNSGWVAVCLHEVRLDVVSIALFNGRPQLEMLESFERSGADCEALKRLCKKYDLAHRKVTTLLPPGEYQFMSVDAPNVPRAEMKEAVRWQLKDLLDFPVEQATLDVIDIPAAKGSVKKTGALFVAVSKGSVVEPLMHSFLQAGVALEAIDIPEMAQRNVAALYEEKDRGLAMLSLDATSGLLTFTFNAELYMVRRVDIGLNQLLGADEERRTQLFERIGLELQRSADNFERQFSYIPLTKLLIAPHPGAEALRNFLGDYISVPVQVFDLGSVMDLTAVPSLGSPERQAQCFSSLGAALRVDTIGGLGS